MWFLKEEDIPIVKQAYFYHTVFFEKIPETQFHDVVRCTSLAVSICLYYHSSQISVRVYVVCTYLKLKDLSEVVHGMWCLVKRTQVSEVHDLLNSVTWIYKIVFRVPLQAARLFEPLRFHIRLFAVLLVVSVHHAHDRFVVVVAVLISAPSSVLFSLSWGENLSWIGEIEMSALYEKSDNDELADSPSRTSSLSAFLASIMWYRSFIWASTLRYNSRAFSASSQS